MSAYFFISIMWALWKPVIVLCVSVICGTNAESLVEVSAYKGTYARVSCSYPEGYESYEKYLCSENCGNSDVLVTTTESQRSRYSISDDTQNRIFRTSISNVDFSDAGKYWCGVSKNGKDIYTEVNLHVKPDECCDSKRSKEDYENNTVSISCPFGPEFVNSFKYLCKGSQPSTCLQQAIVTTTNSNNGQFTLKETQGEFTATITGVTKQNSGSYLCGIQRNNNGDVFSRVDLTVKEWCCVVPHSVKGVLGQSVTLQCPYPSQHTSNTKFLCKGDYRNNCQKITNWDRFRIQDAPSSSSFSVTVTELQFDDAGTYWCGSDTQWIPALYTKIQLSIEWCCVTLSHVKDVVGQSVTLQCPYPSQHTSNTKFLCKGDDKNKCQKITNQGRFRLQDAPSSSSFSVTVTELQATDAGTYWCGSDSQWTPAKYTKIQLSVEYLKSTVSPIKTTEINGTQSSQTKDATISHTLMYVVPAILLVLLVVVASVILYKYSCFRAQEASRNNGAKEEISVNEVYANHDAFSSKTSCSKENEYPHTQQEETLYENFVSTNY